MRPLTVLLIPVMIVASAGCGTDLGLGEVDCSGTTGSISSANILNVQAVPTAKYTPCLDELRLGWDSVEWFAEQGRAGIRITKDSTPFLTATVTKSCDVSEAVAVDSEHPDIDRYEDIESQQADIEVVIVPSGPVPLEAAQKMVGQLADIEIDDRPAVYTIDEAIDDPVRSRVKPALDRDAFVLIIDELDVEEGTVQLRSTIAAAAGHALEPDDAIDLIEDVTPGVFYRGNWYFTFDGGCITYEFNARGILAETVAADANEAIGFFPAEELRQAGRDAGFDLG